MEKVKTALRMEYVPPLVRRVIIGVVGGTILLLGLALIFLPGPAFVVIPVGLAILATEFAWARRYLNRAKELLNKAKRKKREPDALKRERVEDRG